MRNLPLYMVAFGLGVLGAVIAMAAAAQLHIGLAIDVMASPWPVPMLAIAGAGILGGALLMLRD